MASKSETAYLRLREMILSAMVLPGTRFTELELSGQLGLGRFAIREALKRLYGEGMVAKMGTRYGVPLITPQQVREVTQMRSILEVGALRLVTPDLPREVLNNVRNAAQDFQELARKKYFAGALEADLRFHRALVATSQNARLISIYDAANLPLLHVTAGLRPVILDDYDLAAREHLAIAAALAKRQPAKAAECLEDHLKRGEREILVRQNR